MQFVCAFLPSLTGLGWINQHHFAKTKMGYFFHLKFEGHSRYNESLLCNSENGDIAWCNKNNLEWGFRVFWKSAKAYFFKKNGLKKQVFFFKGEFFSTLIVFQSFLWLFFDRTIWNKWGHYQFDCVCAAHLEYRSLVMKKLRINGIWIRKN